MAIQWSGLGPGLLLRPNRDSGQPLRSYLETGLREAIGAGRLDAASGCRYRGNSRELGISRGLVQECLSE